MTFDVAAVKNGLKAIASGDSQVARTAMLIVAKGAFLVMLTFMIVTYAVAVSQTAAPPPEPLPPYIYS